MQEGPSREGDGLDHSPHFPVVQTLELPQGLQLPHEVPRNLAWIWSIWVWRVSLALWQNSGAVVLGVDGGRRGAFVSRRAFKRCLPFEEQTQAEGWGGMVED